MPFPAGAAYARGCGERTIACGDLPDTLPDRWSSSIAPTGARPVTWLWLAPAPSSPPRLRERRRGHIDGVQEDARHTGCRERAPTPAERPLGAYAVLAGAFSVAFLFPLVLAGRRGSLPRRPDPADVALVGVGTFKLSRLLSHAAVTSFIRAPFVRFEGMEGLTTPTESPRGRGLRRAVGELLLCSRCTGVWVAAALTAALVGAPRTTRIACAALAAATVNDVLQTVRKTASHPGE